MSSEMQIYLRDVTPYEFFRYHQAETFYGSSLILQGMQIDAINRAGDQIAGAISGQNYLLSAGVAATTRVYQAIESQSGVLRSIDASIGRNTAEIAKVGSLLITQNSLLEGIGAGIAHGNAISREQLTVQLGIASMVAKASGIDITEVLPQYFPKPPLSKPPTFGERIRSAKARLDVSAATMVIYERLFGEDKVLQNKARYMLLTDEQLKGLDPKGITDGMIFDTYKRGREASNDLGSTLVEYEAQLKLMEDTIKKTVEDSRAKALLEEVRDEVWKGSDAVVLPVIMDLNYACVTGMNRDAIVGYQLTTPPRYKTAEQSMLALVATESLVLEHFPSSNSTFTRTGENMTVIDYDFKDKHPFSNKLRQLDWFEWTRTVGATKERTLLLQYSPFWEFILSEIAVKARSEGNTTVYCKASNKTAEVAAAVRESQMFRMINGRLPQDLKATSDAQLASDQKKVEEIDQTLKQRRVQAEEALRKLEQQLTYYWPRVDIDAHKGRYSCNNYSNSRVWDPEDQHYYEYGFWDKINGFPEIAKEERRRRRNYREAHFHYERLTRCDRRGQSINPAGQIVYEELLEAYKQRAKEHFTRMGTIDIGKLPGEDWEAFNKIRLLPGVLENLKKALGEFKSIQARFIAERDALLEREKSF